MVAVCCTITAVFFVCFFPSFVIHFTCTKNYLSYSPRWNPFPFGHFSSHDALIRTLNSFPLAGAPQSMNSHTPLSSFTVPLMHTATCSGCEPSSSAFLAPVSAPLRKPILVIASFLTSRQPGSMFNLEEELPRSPVTFFNLYSFGIDVVFINGGWGVPFFSSFSYETVPRILSSTR